MIGYSDADLVRSPSDRHFTLRYCVFVKRNLVSWKSKKQEVVVRLSVEVEYHAMTLFICELIWIKQLI